MERLSPYQKLMSEAVDLVQLGISYAEDGAPRTAAARFEAAAKVLVEAADLRDALIETHTARVPS